MMLKSWKITEHKLWFKNNFEVLRCCGHLNFNTFGDDCSVLSATFFEIFEIFFRCHNHHSFLNLI